MQGDTVLTAVRPSLWEPGFTLMNLDTERLLDAMATGHTYALQPVDLAVVAELEATCDCTVWKPAAWWLSSADFERGEILGAVALAPDALLVQRRDGIELRTWDRWATGEIFASWPLPPAADLEGSPP